MPCDLESAETAVTNPAELDSDIQPLFVGFSGRGPEKPTDRAIMFAEDLPDSTAHDRLIRGT